MVAGLVSAAILFSSARYVNGPPLVAHDRKLVTSGARCGRVRVVLAALRGHSAQYHNTSNNNNSNNNFVVLTNLLTLIASFDRDPRQKLYTAGR